MATSKENVKLVLEVENKTKLLSFNASVEAAREDEMGVAHSMKTNASRLKKELTQLMNLVGGSEGKAA